MRLMARTASGAMLNASAILVSGPIGHKVIEASSARLKVSTKYATACCFCKGQRGSCNAVPSKPVLPCTASAVSSSRNKGLAAPA